MRRCALGATLAPLVVLFLGVFASSPIAKGEVDSFLISVSVRDRALNKNKKKKKKKQQTNLSPDNELVDIDIDILCGNFSDVKSGLEQALLRFYNEQLQECDSDRNVTSVTLISWEPALICDEERQLGELGVERELKRKKKKSKGKLNKKSRAKDSDRRWLMPIDDVSDRVDRGLAGNKKKKNKKKTKKKGTGCTEGITLREAIQQEFPDAEINKVTIEETRVDCSPSSSDCTSTDPERGACCGVEGCACNIPSDSLCESEGCCLEEASNYDPCFCQSFDGCGENPCAGQCSSAPTPFPTSVPTFLPTWSPTSKPTSYPTSEPTSSPSSYPTDRPTKSPKSTKAPKSPKSSKTKAPKAVKAPKSY